MFETFNVPGLYLENTAALSLFSLGKNTGIVLESGSVTQSVPVYEGCALRHAVNEMDIGGREITDYLQKMLNDKTPDSFRTRAEWEIVNDIKERLGHLSMHYEDDLNIFSKSKEKNKEYELPDGQIIDIGVERIKCYEIMFNTKMFGDDDFEFSGIDEMLSKSIIESGLKYDDYKHIVLSGGNTRFGGNDAIKHRLGNIVYKDEQDAFIVEGYFGNYFGRERIYEDIINIVYGYGKPIRPCKIIAPPERKYSVWIGGAISAHLPNFYEMCIAKDEYEEYGAKIVNRKCF